MNKPLSSGKCEPCNGNTPKLDYQEIIFKKFKFSNFKKAISFANEVGEVAEKEGHHPDISIGWGYCLVMVHTHAIEGLSVNDFILASKIDLIKS